MTILSVTSGGTEEGEKVFTLISPSPGTGGTHQYLDLHVLVVMGLGTLTCFVGYSVGFGHRLLITQVDRGAPLKTDQKSQHVVPYE